MSVPLAAPHENDPDPERRLRIGYVSGDFSNDILSRYLAPLFSAHARDRFEICCYNNGRDKSRVTRHLSSLADRWRDVADLSDDEFSAQIRADKIDVLVDLWGHLKDHRLAVFACRSAPVQIHYPAYPSTTGVRQIDYRIADPLADPPGLTEDHYVEMPLRLSRTFWCWLPPHAAPPVTEPPVLKSGHVTFGSLNYFSKITPPVIDAWAAILRRLPGSKLMILVCPEGETRVRLSRRFAERDVDPTRIELVGRLPEPEFEAYHSRIDLALDPFPCNGGTTTCHALWLGVPVVSLAGDSMVGRAGLSILSSIGLEDLVARTEEEYVNIAVALASDIDRLARLRRELHGRYLASPLADGVGYAREIENLFRRAWSAWCQKQRI